MESGEKRHLRELIKSYQEKDEKFTRQIADLILDQIKLRKLLNEKSGRLQYLIDKSEDKNPLNVSDHAVIRYLERVERVDTMEVRKKILGSNYSGPLIDGQFPMGTHRVVVSHGVVVTVLPMNENAND